MPRPARLIMPPKDCEPWLYEILRSLQASTQQSAQGLASITRGEVPDGSGDPLGADLTDYFYLPGRNGGQDASGGNQPSDDLILRSTSDDSKGKIFLGEFSAYDEANVLFGINIAAPVATLHIVGSLSGTSGNIVPNSDINTNWVARGGLAWGGIGGTLASAMSADDGVTTMGTINTDSSGTNPQHCGLNGVILAGGTYTVTLRMATLSVPPLSASLAITLIDSNGDGWASSGGTDGQTTPLTEITSASPTFFTVTRTIVCTGTPALTGSTPNSIRLWAQASVAGPSALYIGVTSVTIEQDGSDLLRWDLSSGGESGRIDLTGRMGVGTTTATLLDMLTVIPDTAATIAVKVKGAASQTSDLVRLVNSSDTTLSGFNNVGKPYLIADAVDSATLTSNSSGVGSWATLVSYEDEALFYEDSPVYY